MKHLLLTLITPLILLLPASAQDEQPAKDKTCNWQKHQVQQQGERRPAFSPWEYMKKSDEFITRNANLTVVETNYVCPLLHEMKSKLRQNDYKIGQLLKRIDDAELSENDSRDILEQIQDLRAKKVSIEKEYHKKILKQISANKLLRVIRADMKFDRFMLRKMFNPDHTKQPPHKK
jgi:hypothetical protein